MGKAAGPKGGATRADAAARRAIFAGHELFGGLPAQDIDMLAGLPGRRRHRGGGDGGPPVGVGGGADRKVVEHSCILRSMDDRRLFGVVSRPV